MYHLRETAKPLLLFSVIAALVYIVLGQFIVGLLLGGGRFGPDEVVRTARLLAFFALAIPGENAIHLLVRAFYALKDTWTPILISIPGLGLTWFLSTALIPSLNVNALGIAYAISITAQALILWLLLHRKLQTLT
jgi:putative peptidoglycan lipid II flippase